MQREDIKAELRSMVIERASEPRYALRKNSERLEQLFRQHSCLCLENQQLNWDYDGKVFLAAFELGFDFLLEYIEFKRQMPKERNFVDYHEKRVKKLRWQDAFNTSKLIYQSNIRFFDTNVFEGLLRKVVQISIESIKDFEVCNYLNRIFRILALGQPLEGEDDSEEQKSEFAQRLFEQSEAILAAFFTNKPAEYFKRAVLDIGLESTSVLKRAEQNQTLIMMGVCLIQFRNSKSPSYCAAIDCLPELFKLLETLLISYFCPDDKELDQNNVAKSIDWKNLSVAERSQYISTARCLIYTFSLFSYSHMPPQTPTAYQNQRQPELNSIMPRLNEIALAVVQKMKLLPQSDEGVVEFELSLYNIMALAAYYTRCYQIDDIEKVKQSIEELQLYIIRLSKASQTPEFSSKDQKKILNMCKLVQRFVQYLPPNLSKVFFEKEFLESFIWMQKLNKSERSMLENNYQDLFCLINYSSLSSYRQQLYHTTSTFIICYPEQQGNIYTIVSKMFKSAMAAKEFENATACLNFLACRIETENMQNRKAFLQTLKKDIFPLIKKNNCDAMLKFSAIKLYAFHVKHTSQSAITEFIKELHKIVLEGKDHYIVQREALACQCMMMEDVVEFLKTDNREEQLIELADKLIQAAQEQPFISLYIDGLAVLFQHVTPLLFKQKNSLLVEVIKVCMDFIVNEIGRESLLDEKENSNEEFENVAYLVNQCLNFALLEMKYPSAVKDINEFKKETVASVKEVFMTHFVAIVEASYEQIDYVCHSFFLFFFKTNTSLLEKEKANGNNPEEEKRQNDLQTQKSWQRKFDGLEIIRYLIVNSLYSFNNDEKCKIILIVKDQAKKRLANIGMQIEDEEEEDKFQELTDYSKVDVLGFFLKFALQQAGHIPLSSIFKENTWVIETNKNHKVSSYGVPKFEWTKDELQKAGKFARIQYQMFEYLKTYTIMLNSSNNDQISNHVSYWMIVTSLLETKQLEKLEIQEGEKPEGQFLIFEEVVKLVARFLLKLKEYFSPEIFMFYIQVLNLCYWYDANRAYPILMEAFKETPQYKQIQTQVLILPCPDGEDLGEIGFYTNRVKLQVATARYCVWNLLGLKGLLACKETKDEALPFCFCNIKALMQSAEVAISMFLGNERKETKDLVSQSKIYQTARFNNETKEQMILLALAELDYDRDGKVDEVVDLYLSFYYQSIPSQLQYSQIYQDLKDVLLQLKECLDESSSICAKEKDKIIEKYNKMMAILDLEQPENFK